MQILQNKRVQELIVIAVLIFLAAGSAFGDTRSEGMKKMDEDFRRSVENDLMILETRQKKADILKTIGEAMQSPPQEMHTTTNVITQVPKVE